MSMEYSIQEIIRFAIEIEKDGEFFYNTFAKNSEEPKFSGLFNKLKEEEIKHRGIYENLLDSLGPDTNEYLFHLENEYVAYLHSFIENTIFDKNNIDILLKQLTSVQKIIEHAISKENESIDFYTKMKELLSQGNMKIVDEIISEEYKHIEILRSY